MAAALPTRDDVERAAALIKGRVRRTPVIDGSALGDGVMVKAELFQHAGSFKVRGVTNRLAALTPEERGRGVIGVSAGNHAMALAWGAEQRGHRQRRRDVRRRERLQARADDARWERPLRSSTATRRRRSLE